MSQRCYRCFKKNCLCGYARPVDSGVKFIILMHEKEARKQRTGSGRLCRITLAESELIVGVDFTQNSRVNELICDPNNFPVVLYPGTDALTAKSPLLKERIQSGKKLVVFVIDGTWFCAKKIMDKSLNLQSLPKISFLGGYRSIFTIKREPRPEYVSTIESCYYLIRELQAEGVAKDCDSEPLMEIFKQMIRFQIEAENRRIELGIPSRNGRPVELMKKKEVPAYLQGRKI